MDEQEFLVSYNPRRHAPNWVAWKLDASDVGQALPRSSFRPDEALPPGVYRATSRDYLHSGYDRGHLCPAADRSGSDAARSTTFLLSNVQPQLHELNAGPWEKLEEYARSSIADPDRRLFIVAGGIFEPSPPTIGHGVAVPKASFKIIVALRREQGAEAVSESTGTLAVEMPNERGVGGHSWPQFVTSIDRIEEDTGYDFLPAVSPQVQAVIEARSAQTF